jgi:hypothetical protein
MVDSFQETNMTTRTVVGAPAALLVKRAAAPWK